MTTRRSRLKAVANLPVRRNAVFQGAADNNSNEKVVASAPSHFREKEIITANHCHTETHQKDISFISHNDNSSECGINNNNDKISNGVVIGCKVDNKISNPNELVLKVCESNGFSNNNENKNKESLSEINGNDKCKTFKSKKKVKPNLNSSRSKENLNTDWSNKTDDKLTPLIGTFINSLLVNECHGGEIEASNSSVQNSSSCPLVNDTFATSLVSEIPINVIAVSSLNHYEAEEGDSVQTKNILDELQQPVCNQPDADCEIIYSQELPQPIITSLVDCDTDNSSKLNGVIDCHETDLLLTTPSDSQEICIDDACSNAAVIEIINYPDNEGLAKSIINPTGDKRLLDNLLYQEEPNVVLQNSFNDHSITPKKNIGAIRKKRPKSSNFARKLADARREFQKKYDKAKPDRSTLKMIDLIFYNPTSNPMESKSKFEKKETCSPCKVIIQETSTEEEVDEPQTVSCDSDLLSDDVMGGKQRMPVPQVKIGLNGEIILDEKSVIIETTEAKRGREDLLKNSVPIFEDREFKVSYYRRKTRKTKDWSDFETKRFYKALNTIGPDFSLMQKYFPKRSRMELKNKFKREERLNRSLIDKALNNPSEFDMTQLEKDLAVEKKAEEEQLEMKLTKGLKEKSLPKRSRTKSSLFSREIDQINKGNNNETSSNDLNDRGFYRNENEKKEKEIGQILQKYLMQENKKDINNKFDISISESSK